MSSTPNRTANLILIAVIAVNLVLMFLLPRSPATGFLAGNVAIACLVLFILGMPRER